MIGGRKWGEGKPGMYCTNCGKQLDGRPSLCPHCSTDPELALAEMDAALARFAETPLPPRRTLLIRHTDEGAALGLALLLTAGACIFLSGLTLGVFLLLLLLVAIRVRLSIHSFARHGVDVRHMKDARLHNLARLAYLRLEMPYQQTVVVESTDLNAFTMGLWDSGIVVLHSELVERLTPHELLFVIGHEAGHMRCRHTTWLSLSVPTRETRVPVVSELLGLLFNGWSLKAEYSADRGGMLAARSLHAGIRALVRISTGEKLEGEPEVERYLRQAEHHDALAALTEHMGDHPFLYNRIHSLVKTAEQPVWRRILEPYRPAAPAGVA